MCNAINREHSNENDRNHFCRDWRVGRDDGRVLLGWLRNLLPTLRKCAGDLYGDLQMNDDDNEDAMVTLFFAAFAIFIGLLVCVGMGLIIWSWL
jgi:hypothetical protein